jgi:hypothetical protein
MRYFFILLCLVITLNASGQKITKQYIETWIKECDSTARPELVKAYYIDGQYFDLLRNESEFNRKLDSITIDRIHPIGYSRTKMDNYVPGEGAIGIITVKQKEGAQIDKLLVYAQEFFNDNYTSSSQDVLVNAKDPVLVVDGVLIHHALAKEAIEKISIDEIYDISMKDSLAPKKIYGVNARNGIVQIWTKKGFN